MITVSRKVIALALLGLAVAGPASAMSFSLLTYENADGADVNGLNVWFDVIDRGNQADFIFYNSSSIASNVANIYFERTGAGLDLGSAWIQEESAGVDFGSGGTPSNPSPGGNLDWAGTLFRFRAVNPAPQNGIGNTAPAADAEWLTIRVDYGSSNYSNLIADLGSGDFRVAQHVTGLPQSVWTATSPITDPVPLPPTAWLLGSGLLGWIGTSRFRRRR